MSVVDKAICLMIIYDQSYDFYLNYRAIQEKVILNAEISQKEEILRQELRHEQKDLVELQNEFDRR